MTEKMFVDSKDDYAVTTKPDECSSTSPDGWVCRLDENHDIYGFPAHKAIEIWQEKRWSKARGRWQDYPEGRLHEWTEQR